MMHGLTNLKGFVTFSFQIPLTCFFTVSFKTQVSQAYATTGLMILQTFLTAVKNVSVFGDVKSEYLICIVAVRGGSSLPHAAPGTVFN
jgi:hypothetical protein